MTIKWMTPPNSRYWRTKPHHYLSHIIGHEGPNSLLSHLIKEGLANGLTAGGSDRLQNHHGILRVAISLTEKGEQNYMDVIKIVYSYINQIRKEGPQEYSFAEMQRIS